MEIFDIPSVKVVVWTVIDPPIKRRAACPSPPFSALPSSTATEPNRYGAKSFDTATVGRPAVDPDIRAQVIHPSPPQAGSDSATNDPAMSASPRLPAAVPIPAGDAPNEMKFKLYDRWARAKMQKQIV
jgi:hypothetical protein